MSKSHLQRFIQMFEKSNVIGTFTILFQCTKISGKMAKLIYARFFVQLNQERLNVVVKISTCFVSDNTVEMSAQFKL